MGSNPTEPTTLINIFNMESQELCNQLSESGATFSPYKRNPVPGLSFVLTNQPGNKGIKIYCDSSVNPEYYISKKHRQAVINVDEKSRQIKGTIKLNTNILPVDRQGLNLVLAPNYTYKELRDVVIRSIKSKFAIRNISISLTKFPTYDKLKQIVFESINYNQEYKVTIPPQKANFLVGIDEKHHFVCMLPKLVTSVEAAHEALRPKEVSKGAKRHGEFFFVPVKDTTEIFDLLSENDDAELISYHMELEMDSFHYIKGKSVIIYPKKRPRYRTLYAIGTVFDTRKNRHADLNLKTWHKVYRNLELEPDPRMNTRYYD